MASGDRCCLPVPGFYVPAPSRFSPVVFYVPVESVVKKASVCAAIEKLSASECYPAYREKSSIPGSDMQIIVF